ncbi:MAG TPA: FtsQ-type POTRA domain-containing protein [Gemmatimonadaceae bacterium]|nr:FtsQ-type POTRA domain-containing protein [Gemmatimonadaceae bacterium]
MIQRERLHKPGWKILGILFLVAVIMGAGYGIRAAGREMAFFRIRKVEIRGAKYLSASEVLSRLKVDTLASLWDDLEPYRQRIRYHPQVSDVRIGRRLPGTLVVTIRENPPVALIQTRSGLLPYDSLGKQLPIDPARTSLDLPIVATDDPVLLKLVGAIRATEPRVFARVEEVRRTGRDEILLTLSRSLDSAARANSSPAATRTLRVRVPVGLPVERLADIFPVETDLARRQLHVDELDLRYRDQVIARLQ